MLRLKRELIQKTLLEANTRIFTSAQLSDFLQRHLAEWTANDDEEIRAPLIVMAESFGVNALSQVIIKAGLLHKATLPFPYRQETRYVFGEVDLLDLVQSLSHDGYFTHFTALRLNDLTEQLPKAIYFNVEQAASGGAGQLTQEALDRAFKAEPRLSANVVEYKGTRIVRVNGRNTSQLGVVQKRCTDGGSLRVTDRERTLIDATVRPAYSGGIALVARAFELAKESVSVKKLVAYLRKLRYVYPYHQAIGFYMERAGYDSSLLGLLDKFPIEYDFYLEHGMRSPVLNKRWGLYVPKGF